MSEKLALKKLLFEELHNTQSDIERLREVQNLKGGDDWDEEMLNNSLMYLNLHREFILKLIGICTERNKF